MKKRVARKGSGRHKACPYRRLGDGTEGTARMGVGGQALAETEGVRGQAQGLPLPEIWVGAEETARTGVGGEAQGWPKRR